MPRARPVISSTFEVLGGFDYRVVLAEEIERGVNTQDAIYRARYARDLVELVDPPAITTDAIRYVLDSLSAVPIGSTLPAEELSRIREYLKKDAAEAYLSPPDRARLKLSPEDLLSEMARASGTREPMRLAGAIYTERSTGVGRTEQQFLSFGCTSKGQLVEFAKGAISGRIPLGMVSDDEVIEPSDRPLKSISAIIEHMAGLNPLWTQDTGKPIIRCVALVRHTAMFPKVPTNAIYLCLLATEGSLSIVACNAYTTAVVGSIIQPILFPAGWLRTALDIVSKLLAIIGLCKLAVATAGAGFFTGPSIIGPILLAIALILEILAIVYFLIRLLQEIFGESDPRIAQLRQRADALKQRIAALKSGLQDGSINVQDGRSQLEEITEDTNDLLDDMKNAFEGTVGEEEADSAIDSLQDALNTAVEALPGG